MLVDSTFTIWFLKTIPTWQVWGRILARWGPGSGKCKKTHRQHLSPPVVILFLHLKQYVKASTLLERLNLCLPILKWCVVLNCIICVYHTHLNQSSTPILSRPELHHDFKLLLCTCHEVMCSCSHYPACTTLLFYYFHRMFATAPWLQFSPFLIHFGGKWVG